MMMDSISFGRFYKCTKGNAPGVPGYTYYCHRLILEAQTRRQLVAVEGIDGPDESLLFCCTIGQFAERYEIIPEPEEAKEPEPVADKVAGKLEGSGF